MKKFLSMKTKMSEFNLTWPVVGLVMALSCADVRAGNEEWANVALINGSEEMVSIGVEMDGVEISSVSIDPGAAYVMSDPSATHRTQFSLVWESDEGTSTAHGNLLYFLIEGQSGAKIGIAESSKSFEQLLRGKRVVKVLADLPIQVIVSTRLK